MLGRKVRCSATSNAGSKSWVFRYPKCWVEKFSLYSYGLKKWYPSGYHFFFSLIMNFYFIEDAYFAMLLLHDSSVQYNYNAKRPYVGIILNINGCDYFAPLASPKPKYENHKSIKYFTLLEKGKATKNLGVIKLNCMIPVPRMYLKPVFFDQNTSYGRMLSSQYRYIISQQDVIKKQATTLYDLVVNKGNQNLANVCCKFSLLEEKMAEHLAEKVAAQTHPVNKEE